MSSRQAGDGFALKVGNLRWNPQKWQFPRVQHSFHLNWGSLWLNTRSEHSFFQFRVKVTQWAHFRICRLRREKDSNQLTVPPTPLWYIFPSGLQDVPVWLYMSACAVYAPDSADGAVRWRLSAIPSPLDCNTLSSIHHGPKRPTICLLLLVQRWDISNHLVYVYFARDTLSLVCAHILCPHSRCEKTQYWAPINPVWW